MNNYIHLTDRHDQERIIRTRYPAFTATIKEPYDPCSNPSLTLDGKKICIDEQMHDCPDSKLNWAMKEGLKYYHFIKSKEEDGKG